ncbi:STAS domain-containing protein [Streptomyces sp. NPDC048255]|uniref:STAS domain-containing protein n=1 Tax=Streptomyces sp. NPDC048255 TaxID=3154713 RepID=UPI0033EDA043
MRAESGEESVVVRVGGETDLDRAPLLRNALHAVMTRPDCPNEIVVDLPDLTLYDSSGLNTCCRARLTAQEHGRQIRLHASSTQVTHLLELIGLDQLFLTARPGS